MLNKTSNWPDVLHLHMAELEMIPSLGLFPRLAGPGSCVWRADTLSRARIPHRFLFWFYFYFFVQTMSQTLSQDTSSLIHENRVALWQVKLQLSRETSARIAFSASRLSLKAHSSWRPGAPPAARSQPAFWGWWFGEQCFTKGMSCCIGMTHAAAAGMGWPGSSGTRVLLWLLEAAEIV